MAEHELCVHYPQVSIPTSAKRSGHGFGRGGEGVQKKAVLQVPTNDNIVDLGIC